MSKDDTTPTVTIAGAPYTLTEPVRFSIALDLISLIQHGGHGAYQRAAAVALYVRCPKLAARLGLGPYKGDPAAFGGLILDALVDPSFRGGAAAQSTSRATQLEVYAATAAAYPGVEAALAGTFEAEVEAAAGNSDATP
jgi:hypothetical protein